jgi:DNA-binding MarR family transcriptional regulator
MRLQSQTTRRPEASGKLKSEDYRLLADFRHLLRQFLVFSEERALAIGLSTQQHQALLAIKGYPNGVPTIGDLASQLVIRHNSAVGLVNRLVTAGYVARRIDPIDRRRITLDLTKSGETALEKLTTAHRDELRHMAPLLKPLLSQLQE